MKNVQGLRITLSCKSWFVFQEQKVIRLQEEIKRLQVYEQECFRKDDLMSNLRQEVAELQVKVRR